MARYRMDKRLLREHTKRIYSKQFYEHGVFGRGMSKTINQSGGPQHGLLGKAPFQDVDDDDELEEEDDLVCPGSIKELFDF